MAPTVTCTKCGRANSLSRKSCKQCHQRLPEESRPTPSAADYRRWILISAAALTLLMLLCPPFEVSTTGAHYGYHFIFDAPSGFRAAINISQLMIQWLAVWIAAAVGIYVVSRDDR